MMHDIGFQNMEEALNRCIIDRCCFTAHALCHAKVFQHIDERRCLIMKALIAMNNGTKVF